LFHNATPPPAAAGTYMWTQRYAVVLLATWVPTLFSSLLSQTALTP